MFDRSTKPNIQCTVSVYWKCHFQSELKCSFQEKLFFNVANSGNYSDHSNIPEQRSHSLCSLQLSARHGAAAGADAAGQGLSQLQHLFNFQLRHEEGSQHWGTCTLVSPSAGNVAVKEGRTQLLASLSLLQHRHH